MKFGKQISFIVLSFFSMNFAKADHTPFVRSLVLQNLQMQVRSARDFYSSFSAREKRILRSGDFHAELDLPDFALEKLELIFERFYEIQGETLAPSLLRDIYIENNKILFCSTYSKDATDEDISYSVQSCSSLHLNSGRLSGVQWRESIEQDGYAFINDEEII